MQNNRDNSGRAVVFLGLDSTGEPKLELQQFYLSKEDDLATGEVLLKLIRSSICNSDLHTLQGRRSEPTPSILGHEGCGVVQVSRRQGFLPGDRVTFSVIDTCGSCRQCISGPEQKCCQLFKYGHTVYTGVPSGCYSTHILIRPGTALVPLPAALTFDLGVSLNCGLATMVAVRRTATRLLDQRLPAGKCLIFGAGLLGLYGAALMSDAGMEVFITDVSEDRLKTAAGFGCTSKRLASIGSAPAYDLVIDACGASGVVEAGVPLLQPGGVLLLVGSVTPDAKFTLAAEALVRKCGILAGVHNYQHSDLQDAVSFLARTQNRFDFAQLASPAQSLDNFSDALKLAEEKKYFRVLIDTSH